MREIKFRAYVPTAEIMFYDITNIAFDYNLVTFEDKDDCAQFTVHTDFVDQYTGLKDKNGKEIYEGDIGVIRECIPRGDGEHDDDIVVCEWNNEFAGFFWKGCDCLDMEDTEVEIIGNVHENPELTQPPKDK